MRDQIEYIVGEVFFCAPRSADSYRVEGVLAALGVVVRRMSGRKALDAIARGLLPDLLVVSTRLRPLNANDFLSELSREPAAAKVRTMLLAEREDGGSLFTVALERAGTPIVRMPVKWSGLLRRLRQIPGLIGTLARIKVAEESARQRARQLRDRRQGETKLAGVEAVSVAPAPDG
jgi:hypothetical protein